MVEIEVQFHDLNSSEVIRDVKNAIEFGIRSGSTRIAGDAVDTAQNRIREAGAIWRGILVNSFDWRIKRSGKGLQVVVQNDADQARPIEFGAEYDKKGPPLAPLIPWVKTKMVGFNLEDVDDIPDAEDIIAQAEVDYEGESFTMDLANYTSEDTLQKAFFLQQHIKEEGVDALHFMAAAKRGAQLNGSDTIANEISRRLRAI